MKGVFGEMRGASSEASNNSCGDSRLKSLLDDNSGSG